jgi:alkanesulfonate monooxygenase SsuD/methylene tetrahydromethanopterin reductase-like flavin-dependent oxidoreductase (luciferase family)
LTGKYFDGWYPAMTNLALYKEGYEMVKKGAEEAGRTITEIECVLQIPTTISKDPDEALAAAMKSRYILGCVPSKLRRVGYDVPGLNDYDDYFFFNELKVTKEGQEKFSRAADHITEEMVEDFWLLGTVDDCIEKIEEYCRIGLNQLVIVNLGPDKEKTIEYFEKEIIPYFSDR